MRRALQTLIPVVFALSTGGCYDFVTLTTVMYSTPSWTGANSLTADGQGLVLGLADEDIYVFNGTSVTHLEAPFTGQFGGGHRLTSVAQTHTLPGYEHTFVHGEYDWSNDNLNLLHTDSADLESSDWTWVTPLTTTFSWGGANYKVEQICELAAASVALTGEPHDSEAHLLMSIRACPTSWWAPPVCVGGVLEVGIGEDDPVWWPETAWSDYKVWLERPNGGLFSDECMPISVTRGGQQTTQYLVVGDPSADEISVFNAHDLTLGPLDSVHTPHTNAKILDVTVEGRRRDGRNYGLIATLWGTASTRRIEHAYVMNDVFVGSEPFMVESVAGDVEALSSRGQGADGFAEQMYTLGDRVYRRRYVED